PLVHAVVVESVGEVHGVLAVTTPNGGVGVLGTQVRVHAEAGHEEDVARAVVGVEVAAVVEVAVAGADVLERQRHLMDGELVEGDGHGLLRSLRSPQISDSSCSTAGRWRMKSSTSSGICSVPKWTARSP